MTEVTFGAVIFDSDGVLVDSEALGVVIEMRALAEIGLVFDKTEFTRRFMGMTDMDFMNAVDKESFERLGRGLPADLEERIISAKDRLYRTDLRAIPGIHALINSLGCPKAVASSATVWELKRNLQLTDLFDLFDPHVYSGQLVSFGKPAPDIFLHAADQLNVPPSDCLVIEDSVNGAKAGLAAGMTVWGFLGGGHASEDLGRRLGATGVHAVMRSHDEIRDKLREA